MTSADRGDIPEGNDAGTDLIELALMRIARNESTKAKKSLLKKGKRMAAAQFEDATVAPNSMKRVKGDDEDEDAE